MAQGRELGCELRRVRERTDLSGHHLARLLGWSPPKLSRLETGKRGTSEVDVAIFLARCGASAEELDRLMRLARLTDEAYRLQHHGDKLPDELLSLIKLETTAAEIVSYEPVVIPGLLQTEPYVRELLRWGKNSTGPAFESRVNARLARQVIFNRPWSTRLTFFVHEHALRAVVGDTRLMHEQLLHLILTSSLPRCRIRVVPASAAPVGMFGGSFRFMDLVEDPPVVYAQVHTASLFLEDAVEIARYCELLDDLGLAALNEGQSREWLATLASEYDRAEPASGVSAGQGSSLA